MCCVLCGWRIAGIPVNVRSTEVVFSRTLDYGLQCFGGRGGAVREVSQTAHVAFAL